MTEEEIKEFLNQSDEVVLQDTDSKKSIYSNFIIINRNFNRLKLRFNKLFIALKYVYSLIDVDNIVQEVLNKMSQTKTVINIPVTITPNQTINDGVFKVTRNMSDEVIIERMTKTSEWNTDNYIVQVKNGDKQVVYPVVETKDNKITIYFIDGISSNYEVYII